VFQVVDDRLDDDDGVVHDDADGQHQAEHREGVDREAQQGEEDERPIRETGMVSIGMIVARMFWRKMKTTSVTRMSASTNVFRISWIEASTAGVVS